MGLSPEYRERVYLREKASREAQEKSKAEQKAKNTKYACIGGLGFIILATTMAALVPTSKTTNKRAHDTMAYRMAKEFIKKRLIAPSTAEFPSQVSNGGEVQVVKLASGGYRVSAWLDAENSFGTKLRSNWACELKTTSAGVWNVTGFCDLIE